ncbi:hypothetical protein D3C81_2042510 [compost metagenome]
MEAVVRHVQLVEKLKRHIRFAFRQRQRFTGLLPWAVKGPHAEHVCTIPAESVPIAGGKTQVIFHTLA